MKKARTKTKNFWAKMKELDQLHLNEIGDLILDSKDKTIMATAERIKSNPELLARLKQELIAQQDDESNVGLRPSFVE